MIANLIDKRARTELRKTRSGTKVAREPEKAS